MKFFGGAFLILVTMMLILPLTVGQKNKDVIYTQLKIKTPYTECKIQPTSIIDAPRRTTARPCPEDQRQDSRGVCRSLI
ncbi:hypothetical protein ALC53_11570 [Atta colombica]|uniref:Uncharacterized protein n=1 Tax=Atta colombica TaxID=520822 RepID=A0A195B1D8_9HYME|nr:hypothetical protein ALC53_11570 [Atta colombica]